MRNKASVLLLSAVFAVLGFCAVMALASLPALAQSKDDAVKAFIQTNIDRGISILKNKSITETEKRAQVRDMLTSLLDTKRIGLYALGDARAKASDADIAAYLDAFNHFMVESYVTRLNGYGGETLKITGVLDHAPGDYVVQSVLADPDMPDDPDPVHVDFRVFETDGKFAIVDANIAGVSLGRAQRSDFVGFLSQHDNSVPALTERLKMMTANFMKPEAQAPAQ